jgi:uncharacterized C2H2 Zn-finger protein
MRNQPQAHTADRKPKIQPPRPNSTAEAFARSKKDYIRHANVSDGSEFGAAVASSWHHQQSRKRYQNTLLPESS